MRILVNYDRNEQSHLSILQYHIKQKGLEAIASCSDLSLGDLIAKAKAAKCSGIFLCNPNTLANCVPGVSPTLDGYRGSRLNFSVPTVVGNSLLHAHSLDYGSWLLARDLEKFKTLSYPMVPLDFEVLEHELQFENCYQDILSNAILIAYDIETVTLGEDEAALKGGETIITCCTWSCLMKSGKMKTYVLPMVDFMMDHWETDQAYAAAIMLLRRVNKTPIPKVMHNGMYDCLHSIVYHAEPHCWILDTMAMAHSEFVSLPKTLDFVSSITLPDYIQWKGESAQASKDKDIRRYWAYNARDGLNTLRICIYYLKNLPAYAKKNYAMQFKYVYPALYCAFEGFLVDNEVRKVARAEREISLNEHLRKLKTMVGDETFNPGSWQQVAFYVYDVFGAADPRIGKKKDQATGKKTRNLRGTDEKNLKAIGEQHPILLRLTDSIIKYREDRKAIGTYFDFYQRNSRLLYSLNPFGTETGRMSCISSSFWCGTQVQNIPPYAKGMLIADPGFELMEGDKSKSEAFCTAYLAQDLSLIGALQEPGKDFYKTLGTLFFNIPYELVTEQFRNDVLKRIVHGTNYMMGAMTFIENATPAKLIAGSLVLGIKITMSAKPKDDEITLKTFAGNLLESYHQPFNRIRPWYSEVKTEIKQTHMLVSPDGHTRYFFGDIDRKYSIFSSAVAHGPQHLSVALLNKGFWENYQLVKKYKGDLRMKAQIHDSIINQFKIGREDIRAEVIKCMDKSIPVHGRMMTIPNEFKASTVSWGAMKKLKIN